ncbi:MAG: hypothetical protein JSW40_07480 [Candidatus Omnitrophota bacterium]|nr:MAG: hypothetical protein JSW40_07480 [Candidatus Omnitrophota bacterium]
MLEEAYRLFRRAAQVYRRRENHKQSALCFTSAASCWSKRCGEKTFYNAALSYEEAANEAEKSKDYEYAALLYKYAAINHERDGEFLNFSKCFYRSKELYRKFLTYRLIRPKKIYSIAPPQAKKKIRGILGCIFSWILLTVSFVVWGHGERPSRTLFTGILIVCASAALYIFGSLLAEGIAFMPDFFQALYFSVITFTTVGYGDIVPVGFSKLVAAIESFSGLFIIPLFIIGLSRKYLRM